MNETPERTAFDWDTRFRDDDTPWERPDLHPAVADWTQAGELAAGCSVIIPGCGRAPELGHFARMGLAATGADISPTAIAWQRTQLAEAGATATLIEGDVLAWRPEAPADLVYEQTFLCAIPPRLREAYEHAVFDWLKPGGHLLALFMQKEEKGGPPYGCSLEAMRILFPAERWIWPDDNRFIPYPHPSLGGKPELGGILVRR
ncbi:methyltransferase domain-containing protein [Maricaulis sp.]|uniref:methyltransferase domain-containing protein n=1 Tax=Maricaulis sp. TaxID=1486257 RepID=UPI002619BE9A|nr:methyltransferase domain-containing protein [Maricaulis sp.]